MNINDKYKDLISGSIRSISASFPVLSSVAQAWSEIESHIYKKRIEEFFLQFENELNALRTKLNEIEKNNNIEELVELFQKCIALSKETSNQEKRKLFPKILINTMINTDKIDHETKLNLIESLDYLSSTDIQILQFFKSGESIHVNSILNKSGITHNDRKRFSLFITSLTKLESRGLISESDNPGTKVLSGAGTPDHWINRWKNKFCEILPNGISFLEYIK